MPLPSRNLPAIFRKLLFCIGLALVVTGQAEVTRVEVISRSDGPTSDSEKLVGRLHFAIDPALAGNTVIADGDLAPVDAEGRVVFSADFQLWKPREASRFNGDVWVEIPNRGGGAAPPVELLAQGFAILSVGWEFDVSAGPDKLRLEVPKARNKDGSPIRGQVTAMLRTDKPASELTLSDLPDYPPVEAGGPDRRLVERAHSGFPAGREIPQEQWSVEGDKVRLEGGFVPGKTYELTYLSEAPPVGGLGFAAIRDAVSWIKHGKDSPAPARHVYAFGTSQCGRFLRNFLYLGFNTDEQDRPALDGVITNIAGACRVDLNRRWATPRALAAYAAAAYPFADSAHTDPVSGHKEGLLENPRSKHQPKIFYTNTGSEYWDGGRVGALAHTDPAGSRDIDFPENVRSYYFAGTSHGPARFPPVEVPAGMPSANPVSTKPSTLALRQVLRQWVVEGLAPPGSVVPTLRDGTLTPVEGVRFPAVPGMTAPHGLKAGLRMRNPLWPDGAGEGATLPLLVPQVDADGIDLGGIRLPEVAVPLGTHTGWMLRPPAANATPELVFLRGAWVPFSTTKAARIASGDPRLSVEERYPSKEVYLAAVKTAVQDMITQRFLTEADREPQLQQAGERWDWVMRSEQR